MNFVCTRCKRDVETPGLFCPFCGAPAPQPDAEPSDPYIGRTIAEKYFVNALLGRGGMGQVYKATHLTLDRPVALKMLARSFQSDPSMVQRFHREARAASKLNHPNCISILDFGQAEDGTLFIAMEYLAGRSLATVLSDEFPLGELRVVRIVGQILGALAEAHAAGIIHRDLKLSNVMVESRRDEPDFVKVLDFGIAKLSESGSGGQLTGTGIVCGTPGYMSPEQARGEELDPRSDLYAVGVILYELLAGQLPFVSDTPMGFVTKHMTEIPKPLRELRPDLRISPALDAIVMRVLAKSRDDRPASAEELRELLYTCDLAPAEGPAAPAPAGGSSTVLFKAVEVPPRPSQAGRPGPATAPGLRRFGDPGRPTGAGAPPPEPRAPAPMTPAPPPPGRAPPPSARPPPRTPAPPPRTPAPASEPGEAREPTPPASRRPRQPAAAEPGSSQRRTLLLAGGAAALVVVAVAGYVLLRSDPFAVQPPPGSGAAPGATGEGPRLKKDGAAPTVAQPAPAVPPAQPVPAGPAVPSDPATPAPAVPAPPQPPPAAPLADDREPEPAPAPAPGKRRPPVEKGAGALQIVEGMNVLRVPTAASGQGILTITANPWATVYLDGKELGETPREARVHAGAYRIVLAHPTLGKREAWVAVPAGRRRAYNANLAR
jgi:serine/threonine protein kinase